MKTKLMKEINAIEYFDCKRISEWINKISKLQVKGKLSDADGMELIQLINTKIRIREILEGDFIEGCYVVVNIDGEITRRKVRWSKEAGDLYIYKDNNRYFYGEFK